jgi:tight adherence protein C
MIEPNLTLIFGLVGAALLLLGSAAVMLLRDAASSRLEQRVVAAGGEDRSARPAGPAQPLGGLGRLLQGIGDKLRGGTSLYSEQDLLALESVIAASGLNPVRALPIVLGGKVMLTILVPLLALLYGVATSLPGAQFILLVAGAIAVGILAPDWILQFLRRPYVAALRRGLPDALDLLVVCTEAGMALETALEHVANEMKTSNTAISVALSKLLDELRVLPDRREAFTNFGRRSGVEGIRRLATMLGQTLQYGTPIAEALRAVASDLRRDRVVTLEAKCSKLPALLVLPLICFIMPALFIVLAGGPVLQVLDSLRRMAQPGP